MRNFITEARRRATGMRRSYKGTRGAGKGFFRGIRNAAHYAATGVGRGG